MPIASWPGSRPVQVVAVAIIKMVIISTGLRPIRSPSGPKTNPPSGRTANAAANVPNVAIRPVPLPLPLGKNTSAMVPAM